MATAVWAVPAASRAMLARGRAFAVASRFVLASPIVAVIAAIAALAFVIYRKWDGVVAFFQRRSTVRGAFEDGLLNGVFAVLKEFNPFRLMLEGATNLI